MPASTVIVWDMHAFTVGPLLTSVARAGASALEVRCNIGTEKEDFSRVCESERDKWPDKKARVLVLLNWDGVRIAVAGAQSAQSTSDDNDCARVVSMDWEPAV